MTMILTIAVIVETAALVAVVAWAVKVYETFYVQDRMIFHLQEECRRVKEERDFYKSSLIDKPQNEKQNEQCSNQDSARQGSL